MGIQRIVSFLPSATELLYELGFQNCLDCSTFGGNYTYIDFESLDDINYLSETFSYNWYLGT